jgi:hypothetical protein
MIDWPEHKGELSLTHNQHKSYYKTVQQEIDDGGHGYSDDCWVSPEQRQKAIDTDECWSLQWYPQTPVGFIIMSAADLDVLLLAAVRQE